MSLTVKPRLCFAQLTEINFVENQNDMTCTVLCNRKMVTVYLCYQTYIRQQENKFETIHEKLNDFILQDCQYLLLKIFIMGWGYYRRSSARGSWSYTKQINKDHFISNTLFTIRDCYLISNNAVLSLVSYRE